MSWPLWEQTTPRIYETPRQTTLAFPQPDRFGGDFDFTEALSFAPSVLAMYENNTNEYPETTGTVININSGGRSNLSGIFKGLCLGIMIVFLGKFIAYVPTAVLAAAARLACKA